MIIALTRLCLFQVYPLCHLLHHFLKCKLHNFVNFSFKSQIENSHHHHIIHIMLLLYLSPHKVRVILVLLMIVLRLVYNMTQGLRLRCVATGSVYKMIWTATRRRNRKNFYSCVPFGSVHMYIYMYICVYM